MSNKTTNLRKKHLDAICTKIATFIVRETYADEEADLRKKLSDAIVLIDEASAACVASDEKATVTTLR